MKKSSRSEIKEVSKYALQNWVMLVSGPAAWILHSSEDLFSAANMEKLKLSPTTVTVLQRELHFHVSFLRTINDLYI